MTTVEHLKQVQKLKPFEGGNLAQRNHMNEIIGFINDLIDAANRDAQANDAILNGMEARVFYVNENADVAAYEIPCRLIVDPQA